MSPAASRSSALLVIDVQESFRQRPYFDESELPAFFDRCRSLIDGFAAAGLPVIRIIHVDGDGPFSKASGYAVPMAELAYEPDATFEKNVHSAMIGTGLQGWLTARGISRLVVAGIRTEQCCETTTRNASDLGFAVDYATEATLTFAMRTRAGRMVTPEEIRERTELVLSERFATIVTAGQAVERAVAAFTH
ncbi:MAG: isochorismatase family protein [Burkholderiaceae bacterium]